jgi:hypothetical protein
MNYQYHRKTLLASDSDHPMVVKAISMLPDVETAMQELVARKIDIPTYIDRITEYDKFMYQSAKAKPQKSNPINTLQNKKYSTWREQKWAPVWQLICDDVSKEWNSSDLFVIQNRQVVEGVYSSGYIKFKDVDGGIGFEHEINGRKVVMPVVAAEDKGGHACSTCFDGVSAQSLRLHRCLPNAFHVFITDNNISVGKDKEAETFCDIDLIVSERGKNRITEPYPKLNPSIFQEVRDGLIDRLSKVDKKHFTKYSAIASKKKGKFRSEIDQTGIIWNR